MTAANKNIYQRINEVRKKVSYAKYDTTVQGYKAITHDAVTSLLRNHLIDQGIVIEPYLVGEGSVEDTGTKTRNGAPIIRYAATYDISFVCCDNPDQRAVLRIEAHANDQGDKAPSKALSYATKYAMLKLFSIETGEDDEGRTEAYDTLERISEKQQADIKAVIEELGVNEKKFLEYIKAPSIDEIPAKDYDRCVQMLEAKRQAG